MCIRDSVDTAQCIGGVAILDAGHAGDQALDAFAHLHALAWAFLPARVAQDPRLVAGNRVQRRREACLLYTSRCV